MSSLDRYVWIVLGMYGFDGNNKKIIDVTCIITTPKLERVHKGMNFLIHAIDEDLEEITDSQTYKTNSGLAKLTKKCVVTLKEGELLLAGYIKHYSLPGGVNYLAGNSVYPDKSYITEHMPKVDILLDDNVLDVSTFQIFLSHTCAEKYGRYKKKYPDPRVMDEIDDTLEELSSYKTYFFK